MKEAEYIPNTTPIEANVIVKYFYSAGAVIWIVVGGKELDDGDWILYSYVTLGDGWEWGDVLLSELQSFVGKFGLKIERDFYSMDGKVKDFVR